MAWDTQLILPLLSLLCVLLYDLDEVEQFNAHAVWGPTCSVSSNCFLFTDTAIIVAIVLSIGKYPIYPKSEISGIAKDMTYGTD